MTRAREIDVLVVGLGPAGARAAAVAAQSGYVVLAIDRKHAPGKPVQCAEFVPALIGQETDGLNAVTRQVIEAMTTSVEGAPPDVTEDFRGRMIDREAFDRHLADLAGRAGAECRFATRLVSLDAHGEARLDDGTRLRPRLIIGADGPRSPVGRAVGRVNHALVETRQITVPLTRPCKTTNIFLSTEIRGGYAWLFPKAEIANLGVGVSPTARATLKPLLDRLHHALCDEGRVGAEILGHTGGAIPVGGMLDAVAALGEMPVLLAGDAAGLSNPVTGAGIASAVISGGLAGDAASAWLGGDGSALADYATELDDIFGVALRRALSRRCEILQSFEQGGQPSPARLRHGWIAYPEYWAA